jgi:quinol monooxygenase YgiN
MYGYSTRIEQPIDLYHALHRAIMEIAGEDVEGLILHYAHPTPGGFVITEVWEEKEQLEAFNRNVMPQVLQSTGVTLGEAPPEVTEFDPVVVVTPRAFNSDL